MKPDALFGLGTVLWKRTLMSEPRYSEVPIPPQDERKQEQTPAQNVAAPITSPHRRNYLSHNFINAIFLSFILFVAATLYGSSQGNMVPTNEAVTMSQELLEQIKGFDAASIFINNCLIALISLIPGLGSLFLLYVIYNSGYLIGVIAKAAGYGFLDAVVVTFITPFGMLEILSYSLALAESFLLLYLLAMKRVAEFKERILRSSWVTVIAIVVTLGAAALIEASMIGL